MHGSNGAVFVVAGVLMGGIALGVPLVARTADSPPRPPSTNPGAPPSVGAPPGTAVEPPRAGDPPSTAVGPPRTVVGPPRAGAPPSTVVGPPRVGAPPSTVVGPPGAAAGAAANPGSASFSGTPVFESLDADRDGRISGREANANRLASLAFAHADTDRDGSISQAEFRAAFTSATSP